MMSVRTAVTLAEMCIAGGLGAMIELGEYPNNPESQEDFFKRILFSESLSGFVVEVREEDARAFESLLGNIAYDQLATVTNEKRFIISGRSATAPEIIFSLDELEQAYRGPITSEKPAPEENFTSQKVTRPTRTTQAHSNPKVMILHANGTNRDHDAALACELAGGEPEIVHINQLLAGERNLLDYHMLVVPGGFSYGDDLGAGQLWAQDLRYKLRDDLERFALNGRPVLL